MKLIVVMLATVLVISCALALSRTQRVDEYQTARVRIYRLDGRLCRLEVLLPGTTLLTGVTRCLTVSQ